MADIHYKLAQVAGEIGSINKTERNEQQGFNFRSIEQITGAIRPLFAKAGISVAPRVISLESSEVTSSRGSQGFRAIVHMAYTFTAGSDGSSVETSMVGEAVDYGDKSTSKAVQMAYKYALTQILQVGSGDDPDAHSVDVGSASQPRQRSGGRRGPTPNQAADAYVEATIQALQSHETAPTTNGAGIVGETLNRIRSELLQAVKDDKPRARMIWRTTLETFGLSPTDEIPADMLEPIETAIKATVAAPA